MGGEGARGLTGGFPTTVREGGGKLGGLRPVQLWNVDLISAGLQVAPARLLMERISPGGDVYTALVVHGRLVPTKVQPPKLCESNGSANPSNSGCTGSSRTFVEVPRRIKSRVEILQRQLSEQDRLSRACRESFETLSRAIDAAAGRGVIDPSKQRSLRLLNEEANAAKHEGFVH